MLPAPSAILLVVGWAVLLVEEALAIWLPVVVVEVVDANEGFGNDEPAVVVESSSSSSSVEVLEALVVVLGATVVLVLEAEVVVAAGVCETRPPVTL